MRLGCLVTIIALAALDAQGAMWKRFRAPAKSVVEHEKGFLWLEVEEFSDYGTWVIDTQFVGIKCGDRPFENSLYLYDYNHKFNIIKV